MELLLILNYQSDAERKRIDYAIERWKNKINIKKPKGTTILVKCDERDFNKFIEDLFSRLELDPNDPDKSPKNKVETYLIEKYEPEIEMKTKLLKYKTYEKREVVERFLDYLMAKINAAYEYSTEFSKIYTAYTKKGQARLELRIKCNKEKTEINILIEGYGEVVKFLSDKIDYEIKTFLGGEL